MSEELELEERAGLLPAEIDAPIKPPSQDEVNGIHPRPWSALSHKSWRDWIRTGAGLLWASVCFLLPSFISRFLDRRAVPESSQLRPTAWLDGLRGLAAWAVFNEHLATTTYKDNYISWGRDGSHYEFFRMPGFRLLYSGPFAVALFFVISGYVLSITSIHQMSTSPLDADSAVRKTGSAIFRRPIRLILPTWASNLFVFYLVRTSYLAGLQLRLPQFNEVIHGATQLTFMTPRPAVTLWRQIVDVMKTNVALLRIFTSYLVGNSGITVYNSVTWTIPLELRSSLILYATHLMLYFTRPRWRSGIVLFLIFAGILAEGYDPPLFWAGFLIAQSCETKQLEAHKKSVYVSVAWWVLLLVGVFIGSFPEWEAETAPLFSWMIPLSPFGDKAEFRFFTGLGSVFAVLAISKLSLLTYILSISPIQYLGRISFGLYLVQIWIINGVGMEIFYNVWSFTGKETLLAHVFGFIVAYFGVLGVSIWVADIFWRAVDRPSVSLGYWLEKWMFQAR